MIRTPSSRRAGGLALSVLALALLPQLGGAQQMTASVFNEGFLELGGGQQNVDLSLFKFGNQVVPGSYLVDVLRNGSRLGQNQIQFFEMVGKRDAQPCLTTELLDSWGVNVAAVPGLAAQPAQTCVDLSASIPDAAVVYDGGQQRLLLSIPQAALKRAARGAVDPDKWDQGITAAMLDYQLNMTRYDGANFRNDRYSKVEGAYGPTPSKLERNTVFGGLRGGFNLGDWRVRHYSTYNRGLDGKGRWQSVQTYAQRDIQAIRGQLLLGDGYTSGNLFDGFQFRGVQLSSDDDMLPDSMRGYAPTIRGVAQTNAQVTVRQNGYILYNTYVAPGPFVLNDLYPTSGSGDLEVTITEADGRITRYTQAFSAVPTLLREGSWQYSATAGQYRNGSGYFRDGEERPYFLQGTLARGLAMDFSLYGGATLAQHYQAGMLGVGKNMRGFGAVSLDLTQARSKTADGAMLSGQSLRFLYAKTLEETDTTIRMAGYRYSTSDYRTFTESVQMRHAQDYGLPFINRRNEIRLDVSQSLGELGSLYASARQQSYWSSAHKDKFIQVGYSGSYRQLSYNLFYSQYSNMYGPANRQVMLTLSIPLGSTQAYGMYTVSRDNEGRVAQQASVFGSAFDDHRMSYGLTVNRSNRDDGSSGSANLNYKSPYGQVALGRSQGQGYGQTNLSLAGGVVAHADGVTLSQPLGETIALVRASRAQGVGIESQTGVRTDWAGSAVIPSINPYRSNRVALVTQDLGDSVDVKYAALEVVPTRGAVVLAPFETSVGYRLMLTLSGRNGQPLPFGARIDDESGKEVGMVGPEGQAYVTGAAEAGTLQVVWGQQADARCQVKYQVPQVAASALIRELKEVCQ